MELTVGWHIYGLILVALATQMTYVQNCSTGNNRMQVVASASYNRVIKSPYSSLDYHNNTECSWLVKIEDKFYFPFSGYVIKVIFNDFELQAGRDSSDPSCPYGTRLTFYDGYSIASPLLGSYCGTVHPEVIYSTGINLYIKFHTGSSITSRGFSINVSVVEAEEALGICRFPWQLTGRIKVNGSSCTIFTPDFPVPYQDNTTCGWLIYVPDGERVNLTFTDFELGKSVVDSKDNFCIRKSVDMDYVEVSEGNWFGDKPRGIYCGKKTPFNIYSSGSHMWVSFHASRDGVRENKGFKARFEAIDVLYDEEYCLPENTNNLNLKLTGSYGTLQSPEYYPPVFHCEWLITVPKGNIVELSFERLDLDFQTSKFASSCGDYVQIKDGDSKTSDTIDTFCGNVIPKPLKSSGRYMYIRFHSDVLYDTPRRGFKASFRAVKKRLSAVAVAINVVVSVVVVIILVCCVVCLVKRKRTRANRAAGVEIPMSTITTSASRSRQPGVVQELHQSEGTPSVAYALSPRNLPPPDYPYPLEPPPPYPGKEGEPQYPPPGQPYPWQQSSDSARVTESP